MIITDTHVYFYTETFSNFTRATFRDPISDKIFGTTEQAFMWYKADFFKDYVTRDKIAADSHPRTAKHLGRLVNGYNDIAWDLVRLGYMTYVNYLKYSQNENFKKELLDTGDRILVEASPTDKVWGVGLSEDNPLIFDEKTWKGSNLLGLSLGKVREILKTK